MDLSELVIVPIKLDKESKLFALMQLHHYLGTL